MVFWVASPNIFKYANLFIICILRSLVYLGRNTRCCFFLSAYRSNLGGNIFDIHWWKHFSLVFTFTYLHLFLFYWMVISDKLWKLYSVEKVFIFHWNYFTGCFWDINYKIIYYLGTFWLDINYWYYTIIYCLGTKSILR
jgi:hypothetical protein